MKHIGNVLLGARFIEGHAFDFQSELARIRNARTLMLMHLAYNR